VTEKGALLEKLCAVIEAHNLGVSPDRAAAWVLPLLAGQRIRLPEQRTKLFVRTRNGQRRLVVQRY